MAKDKKKKKKDKKAGKSGLTVKRLQSLTENPMVANIVASALVATAAAIKDPAKARKLAAQTGDQLTDLAKDGVDRGNAMWQLALDVGRRALEEFGVKEAPKAVRTVVPKATRKVASKAIRKVAPKATPKTAAKKTAAKKTASKTTRKVAPKATRKAVPKVAAKAASKARTARSSRPKK
jgi:hypothetical protein